MLTYFYAFWFLEQLNEIRKTSLARIICDNADDIREVQPRVFVDKDPFLWVIFSTKSSEVPGSSLTEPLANVYLSMWRHIPGHKINNRLKYVEIRGSDPF